MKIIDITQELFSRRVFPGDSPTTFERVKTIESDKYNLTNIRLLAKLIQSIKITNTCDKIESQTETSSAITITL
jgi:hypothetical protein